METNGHSFKNVTVIQSRSVQYLLMKVRNKKTKGRVSENIFDYLYTRESSDPPTFQDYVIYADRLMRILAEEAICRLPHVLDAEIETPCGKVIGPIDVEKDKLCVVSIVRSGEWLPQINNSLADM